MATAGTIKEPALDDYFRDRKADDAGTLTSAQLEQEIARVEGLLDLNIRLNGRGLEEIQRGMVETDLKLLNAERARRNNKQRPDRLRQTSFNDGEIHLTDLGNAARMASLFGDDIRYSLALGWLIWDGKRWRRDDTQEIRVIARHATRNIYNEAADEDDKGRRQGLAEWAHKSESEQKIGAMVRLCESEPNIAVTADLFDRDPWLFNCDNGTLDLRTGKLQDHRREDYITKITPVAYEEDMPCVRWEKFLEQIFNGDFELANYLQRVFGYSLTGDTREQEFYLFHGLGANGKTTLVRTWLRMLGDYGTQSPVDTLMVKKNGGGIPNDIARLAGARMVAAMESEAGQRLAESLVKSLTGGDRITARFLHKECFEFEPQFKLILSTNHRPRIHGTDHAIWRRIRLVPFNVRIPDEQQDKGLSAS